jgi:heme/copper-type cytochrome/quinol oxidase subunit 2
MDQVDMTWGRALKVWWSFCWRSMVLFFLIVFPLELIGMIFMFRYVPHAGQKDMDPQQSMRMARAMMIAWPILMALMVAIQAQGMRWMFRKARWSDFRLAVLPREQ